MTDLLVLVAHPDDEFFCSGAIAAATRNNVSLHVVYWTRGEGGSGPRRRRWWSLFPRGWHPRMAEARAALRHLEVRSLEFLNYVDPVPQGGLKSPDHDPAVLTREIVTLLEQHQPGILLTHGSDGDYGHPAHRSLFEVAQAAVQRMGETAPALLTFNASGPQSVPRRFLNPNDSADVLLDCEPSASQRLAALTAHRSQKQTLESMTRIPGASLEDLVQLHREEGYRCWETGYRRAAALTLFGTWTGAKSDRVPTFGPKGV